MTPEILSENQLKAENNLRLNWNQSVRKESGRIQRFTIFMQEDFQFLPNKLPFFLNNIGCSCLEKPTERGI